MTIFLILAFTAGMAVGAFIYVSGLAHGHRSGFKHGSESEREWRVYKNLHDKENPQ